MVCECRQPPRRAETRRLYCLVSFFRYGKRNGPMGVGEGPAPGIGSWNDPTFESNHATKSMVANPSNATKISTANRCAPKACIIVLLRDENWVWDRGNISLKTNFFISTMILPHPSVLKIIVL